MDAKRKDYGENMFCPIIKEECRTDCMYFKQRRKRRINPATNELSPICGECSLVNVTEDLKKISESINQ